jgi:hypothetical protein
VNREFHFIYVVVVVVVVVVIAHLRCAVGLEDGEHGKYTVQE